MSQSREVDKRLIWAGSLITAALAVLLWFVQPPPPGPDAGTPEDAAPRSAGVPSPSIGGSCEACPVGTLCFTDRALPEGVCTRGCAHQGDCPAGWCCYDPHGAGEARDFICAPAPVCEGRVRGTPPAPDAG